jgi:protein involved in polysaccharide export with SLBB domain
MATITERGAIRSACARAVLMSVVVLVAGAHRGIAQRAREDEMPRRAAASRQELDSLVASAEAAASATAMPAEKSLALQRYASDLRARLREGDFQAGDQIVLAVRGDSTLSGTFTVLTSRTLVVPKLPPIPLEGVLRSELQPYLSGRLRPYVRDTLLQGTPLVRIGVLGDVARPGYYRVSLDQTLSDALMAAGGPMPQADVTRTTMRRGSTTVMPSGEVRDAMIRGVPLRHLDVDAGDELLVVTPKTRNWGLITQIAGLATGVLLAVQTLRR